MSEYQYYEFQTIDRQLTAAQMQQLRRYSSRADITATRFVNEYHWGDFKGDPDEWMDRYFDAFLYFANWGTRTLMLRLPAALLSPRVARDYCDGNTLALRAKASHVVLTFHLDADGGDHEMPDDAGLLSSLVALRSHLGRGDLRALYVGWLAIAQNGDLDDDAIEPPVPPGLGQLDDSLEALVAFLRIDADLLEVAAQASPAPPAAPSQKELADWIATLAVAEKDRILTRLVAEPDDHSAASELAQRFHATRDKGAPAAPESRRKVGTLLETADRRTAERTQAEAAKAAAEQARREREAAEARVRHLDRLAGQEQRLWSELEGLIATRLPKNYDLALQHLIDLRDLAARSGEQGRTDFAARLAGLRALHARKPSLLERLGRVGASP